MALRNWEACRLKSPVFLSAQSVIFSGYRRQGKLHSWDPREGAFTALSIAKKRRGGWIFVFLAVKRKLRARGLIPSISLFSKMGLEENMYPPPTSTSRCHAGKCRSEPLELGNRRLPARSKAWS